MKRYALMLHMRPGNKEGWAELIKILNSRGVDCDAIDFPPFIGLKEQQERDGKVAAARAGLARMLASGARSENIILIGGSIGANIAIRLMSENQSIPLAVALSPGMNYIGVTTGDAIASIAQNQKILLVASDDDAEAMEAVEKLNKLVPRSTDVWKLSKVGHAERMLKNDPALMERIAEWIGEN